MIIENIYNRKDYLFQINEIGNKKLERAMTLNDMYNYILKLLSKKDIEFVKVWIYKGSIEKLSHTEPDYVYTKSNILI